MSETLQGNRRGRRSREEILEAAARVMAARGYAGTSISVISAESGLPKSAIYHHFHSKGGLLSAVMARGLYDFFEAMRVAQADPPADGTPYERLQWYLRKTAEVFEARSDFLRLHMLLIMSEEAADVEVRDVIAQVRGDGRAWMNHMIRSAFEPEGEQVAEAVADALDHFAMAGFDGAFIAFQAEGERTVLSQMEMLCDAVVALGEAKARELARS